MDVGQNYGELFWKSCESYLQGSAARRTTDSNQDKEKIIDLVSKLISQDTSGKLKSNPQDLQNVLKEKIKIPNIETNLEKICTSFSKSVMSEKITTHPQRQSSSEIKQGGDLFAKQRIQVKLNSSLRRLTLNLESQNIDLHAIREETKNYFSIVKNLASSGGSNVGIFFKKLNDALLQLDDKQDPTKNTLTVKAIIDGIKDSVAEEDVLFKHELNIYQSTLPKIFTNKNIFINELIAKFPKFPSITDNFKHVSKVVTLSQDKWEQGLQKFKESCAQCAALLQAQPNQRKDVLDIMLINLKNGFNHESATNERKQIMLNMVASSLKDAIKNDESSGLWNDIISLAFCKKKGPSAPILHEIAKQIGIDTKAMPKMTSQSTNYAIMFHAAPHGSGALLESVEYSLQIGLNELANKTKEVIHPIFIGNEWRFMAADANDFIAALDDIAEVSKKYPEILFIPGSIAWTIETNPDPKGDGPRYTAFNTMPVFSNGQLIHLYHKKFEKQDIQTLSRVFKIKQQDFAWGPKDSVLKGPIDSFNANTFLYNNTVFATEICNDHVNNAAKKDYHERNENGSGVNIQILMAHGTIPGPQRATTTDGGYLAYVDHSSDTVTRFGKITQGQGQNIFTSKHGQTNNNTSLLGALRSHIVDDPVKVEPTCRPVNPHDILAPIRGHGPLALLSAVSIQMDKSIDELIRDLTTYLENTKKTYNNSYIPNEWNAATGTEFFSNIRKHYAFRGENEIQEILDALKTEKNLEKFEKRLPQLLSAATGRCIVFEHDLAAMPAEILSPDWRQRKTLEGSDALNPISIRASNIKGLEIYTIPIDQKKMDAAVEQLDELLKHQGVDKEGLTSIIKMRDEFIKKFNSGRTEEKATSYLNLKQLIANVKQYML